MSHLKRPNICTRLLLVVIAIISMTNDKSAVSGETLNESNGSRHASSLIHNTVAAKEMHIDESLSHRHTDTTPASTGVEDNSKKKGHEGNHLLDFLADMKSGTKVFQHFFMHSNLTQIVEDGSYTILIPSDNAFQRWHPIDWGFYPFSVPEFTESILRNHFLPMQKPLRLDDIKEMNGKQKFKALGGEIVTFRGKPQTTANNVTILNESILPNGNTVLILGEVLFVTEAVVSKLHQMHKDKETPPLLAFPWFGAQFLSHAFLSLERDSRFTQVTRFLNAAEVAPYVSGSNYTFFVPTDEAFERHGFDILSDDVLASGKGVNLLLNHFIRGRLYNKDLKNDEIFETIGGKSVKIQRKPDGNVTVNNALIIEAEVFVYNLGTMFYIDEILYPETIEGGSSVPKDINDTEMNDEENTAEVTTESGVSSSSTNTQKDVELFTKRTVMHHHGLHEEDDDEFEPLDDEIVTPRVLPVKYEAGIGNK